MSKTEWYRMNDHLSRIWLPDGYFIDREESAPFQRAQGGFKYAKYKSGAHPSGCAAVVATSNKLADLLAMKEVFYEQNRI